MCCKSALDTDYIIHQGSDLVSDLPLNAHSRRILWKGPYRGCISVEMIDRSMLRPDCRTKAGVILQVGIIITSLPETDQSLLQDTERRVWFFWLHKGGREGRPWRWNSICFPSGCFSVKGARDLACLNDEDSVTGAGVMWRRVSRFRIQWSERIWDMCWYRR